jgi:ribose/xylose/arabinose/galactoside ABC-type transport system permease subunit
MWNRTKLFLLNNGTLLFTILIFVVGYYICGRIYPAMQKPQVFFNLFINNASLLLVSIGMTFVVISGGIDLSVASMLALTSVASAVLLQKGVSPYAVVPIMMVMGVTFGCVQGLIIHRLKVEAFVVTLMGSFFCRGMAYIISLTSVSITDPVYKTLGLTKVLIPGFGKTYVYIYSIVAIVIFLAAIYIGRYTRFGRSMYAIGGTHPDYGVCLQWILLISGWYRFQFCAAIRIWAIRPDHGNGCYCFRCYGRNPVDWRGG